MALHSCNSTFPFHHHHTMCHKIILVSIMTYISYQIIYISYIVLISFLITFLFLFSFLSLQEQNLCLVFSPCLFYQIRQPESPAMRCLVSFTKLDSVYSFDYTIEEKRSFFQKISSVRNNMSWGSHHYTYFLFFFNLFLRYM